MVVVAARAGAARPTAAAIATYAKTSRLISLPPVLPPGKSGPFFNTDAPNLLRFPASGKPEPLTCLPPARPQRETRKYWAAFSRKRRSSEPGLPPSPLHAMREPITPSRPTGPPMNNSAAATPIRSNSFFSAALADADPEIARAIELELGRQRDEIELIASENIVSRAVLEAQGSVLTNKYAEGYPGRRYYGGCQFVDIAEKLAIERACKLFGCKLRQCAAEFRQPGQSGRVHGADAAGRHLHGPRSRRRRPSDPRLAGQHVRPLVQAGRPTASTARRSASTWTRSSGSRASTSRS